MIKINIKNKDYLIPPISELSFNDFHNIIIKGSAYDIPSYISIYTDVPLKDLKKAKLVCKGSLKGLHRMIFDLDIHKVIKTKKEVVGFRGEYISINDIGINYFYQSYFYDMYLQKYEEKKIDFYELTLYALAVGLLPSGCTEIKEVSHIFNDLCLLKWKDVLPQAFFLHKHTKKKSLNLIIQSKAYTLGLRKAQALIYFYRSTLGKQEKKQLYRSFVNYFNQIWTRS